MTISARISIFHKKKIQNCEFLKFESASCDENQRFVARVRERERERIKREKKKIIHKICLENKNFLQDENFFSFVVAAKK